MKNVCNGKYGKSIRQKTARCFEAKKRGNTVCGLRKIVVCAKPLQ